MKKVYSGLMIRIGLSGFGGLLVAGQIADLVGSPQAWPSILAPLTYLAGLWFASGIFVRLDAGDTFDSSIIKGLNQVGTCLTLGAFFAILVAPALVHLQANGFAEMRGMVLELELANLMLAVTGLVLILIARRGADLRAQLESFV